MKGRPARRRTIVPIERRRMRLPMLSPKARVPMDAKTKALSPKAERGNAVAVPR